MLRASTHRTQDSRITLLMYGLLFLLLTGTLAQAHFGAIIPSDDIVSQTDGRTLNISAMFFHPFEGHYMEMAKPVQFGVLVQGKKQDLSPVIQRKEVDGCSIWVTEYRVKRPGDHVFYLEPAPYFEPAEESFIVHYTKVIVSSMSMEIGWDEPVGLETEILPLSRPYGLWAGNLFQGQVLVQGRPAPGTEVEVEYYNTDGVVSPADAFITQVVKADDSGIFTYAMPWAGWWGFAALNAAKDKRRHTDGNEYDVEIGAVLWVKTHEMRR